MKIIECPRDAWQGLQHYIPVNNKARYLNTLLKIGFDTLDFGSFVSPRIMPQVRDTAELISLLDLKATSTRLLSIVANEKGAELAAAFPEIDFLGYPFSVSETFQIRNTHRTMAESLTVVKQIMNIAVKSQKTVVIYLSMGFGNPYGDAWHPDIIAEWVEKLHSEGITIFSLSDTVGIAAPEDITYLFSSLTSAFPQLEFGAHFHATPADWKSRIRAAYESGCRRFDGSIAGYGGCPMAQNELVGNIATENLLAYFKEAGETVLFNEQYLKEALELFPLTISPLSGEI